MHIRVIYDPILRQSLPEVTVFDAQLKKEADEMLKLMHRGNGIGLAGSQVGLKKRIVVMEYTPNEKDEIQQTIPKIQIVNPKIIKFSNETDMIEEGCLSLPGLQLLVRRALAIVVEGQDLTGKKIKIKAKNLTARVLQHEIDHLDGILFPDRAEKSAVVDLKNYAFARIIFAGSDEFSLPVLRALVENGLNVMAVITETDKPSGRGQKITKTPVSVAATQLNIPVFQPDNKEDLTEIVKQLTPDLAVLASYGKIIPPEALKEAKYGWLNLHPSLLPKYRGSTPIQSAILNGDKEAGVTLMVMDEQVDTGLIVDSQSVSIPDSVTADELRDDLAKVAGELLIRNIPLYLSGQSKLQLQNNSVESQTKKLSKEMAEIDWTEPVEVIDRKIRAFQGWPGTFTYIGKLRLKIISAEVKQNKLRPILVQIEGKTPAKWDDFVRGYSKQLSNTDWFGKIG